VNKGVDQMGDINIEVGGDCPRCGLAFGDINLGDATSEDVESLSRMLFQEVGASQLGSKSGREELAGVAYTALNRLKGGKRGSTLTDVITSGNGYGKQGNKRAYGTATDERLQGHEEEFAKVRSFAKDVIAGKVANPVGSSTAFFHDTKGKGYGTPGAEQHAMPPFSKSMKNVANINSARFYSSKGKDVPERPTLDTSYTKTFEGVHGHKSE
jgi:spore germination cell wall hydrolase CwlJ-like protein